MNYDQILSSVKDGKMPDTATLRHIRRQLDNGHFEAEPYTLLHILGKAKDISSHDIIARHCSYGLPVGLTLRSDLTNIEETFDDDDSRYDASMVRRIAVMVLGQFWQFENDFDLIYRSAASDPSGYVRMIAAHAVGQYGAKYPALGPRAARLLVSGVAFAFSDPNAGRWYYDGLLDLFGVPFRERPAVDFKLQELTVREDLLESARAMAASLD